MLCEFVLTEASRKEPAFVLTPFQVDDVRPTDIGLREDQWRPPEASIERF
jgi:hypothetical protein